MKDMFAPFKMPDLCSRPEGRSKSLKEAYIYLRRRGFPDRDIFIYAQGEFSRFKGDMLEQQPQAGDMIFPGNKITLVAAVTGICQMMPDLFTDHIGGFLNEDRDPRQGAANLYAIFDSMFLKILCRLEWIRDIYAGVYRSFQFIDYLNSIFFISEDKARKLNVESLGFLLSRLSRFGGTESALRVFFESATGLRIDTEILGNQREPVPADSVTSLGGNRRLGEDVFLGDEFEAERSELRINFNLDKPEDVLKAVRITEDRKTLEDMFRLVLPYYVKQCRISIEPDSEKIGFVSGDSYLGFSTALNSGDYERS